MFWLVLLTTLVMAYLLRIVEVPYYVTLARVKNHAELSFWEGYLGYIYLVIMTITTVGFGDITAKSMVGKYFLIFSAVWGAFLLSLIVLVVANMFDL